MKIRQPNDSLGPTILVGAIIALIFCSATAKADTPDYYSPASILLFADHLFNEQDYLRAAYEYQRYLFLRDQTDPLRREIMLQTAKSFQCAGEYDRSLALFDSLLQSGVGPSGRQQVIYEIGLTYFHMQQYARSLDFLQDQGPWSDNADILALSAANLMLVGQWQQAVDLLDNSIISQTDPLHDLAREGTTMRRKSPAAAALLSSVIPGLGKIYAGEIGDGFQSLLFIGLLGTLSVLSFHSDGVESVPGWIYASAGAILHVGNIYGSVVSARRYNRLQEEALHQDVKATIPACSESTRVH
jgi:TM2 domain-containing membrane protein YozV